MTEKDGMREKKNRWGMRKRWVILAVVLLAAEVSLRLLYSPMRFTAFLLLCAAALSLVWGFLEARRARKPFRIARRVLAVCLVAGFGLFSVLEIQVIRYSRTDWGRDVSAVVVLGAGVNGTEPSLSLLVRLEAALDYLSDKPDIPVVVTGSKGPGEDISEAQCMADWLASHGIAERRILLEEQADNTEENIRFSKELLAGQGIDLTGSIAVVSSDYHLYRASLYWASPGFVPVAAHMPGRYLPLTINYYIREAFAAAKLLVFDR